MSRVTARLRRPAESGEPVRVLLLHGLGGKPSVWDPLVARSDGRLELWDAHLPWRAMTDGADWGALPDPGRCVRDLVDEGYDAVVAHSYAANLITEALAAGQPAPRRTVLISPFYRPNPEDFDWSVISYYLNDFHRAFEEALAVGETARFARAHRDWMARRLRDRIGPYGWMRFFESYLRTPFLDLTAVRTELLVLSGAQDIAARAEDGRALAGAVRGARFELLEECGHFPMVEAADRVTRLVCDFLAADPCPARHAAAAPVSLLEKP